MNNTKKINDIINSSLSNCIKASDLYISKLDSIIKIYERQIDLLKINKPCVFQRKKIQEHNKQIEEYKIKIMNLYRKMIEEMDCICEIEQIIKS